MLFFNLSVNAHLTVLTLSATDSDSSEELSVCGRKQAKDNHFRVS